MNKPIARRPLLISTWLLLATAPAMTQPNLATLFANLKSDDLEVKNTASRGLLQYAKWWVRQDLSTMRQSLPVLLEALEDADPGVRLQASAFLGGLTLFRPADGMRLLKPVLEVILIKTDDPDPQVRANILRSLALLEPSPPPEAVEAFFRHLEDPPGEARRLAVIGLLRATPQSQRAAEAVGALLDQRRDSEGRREILQALAFAKPAHPVLVAKVAEQLGEPNPLLQQDALHVLGAIGPAAAIAIHKIREIVQDPKTGDEVRASAEAALQATEQRLPPRAR